MEAGLDWVEVLRTTVVGRSLRVGVWDWGVSGVPGFISWALSACGFKMMGIKRGRIKVVFLGGGIRRRQLQKLNCMWMTVGFPKR